MDQVRERAARTARSSGTTDRPACQTNLLALIDAVEAARAGVQHIGTVLHDLHGSTQHNARLVQDTSGRVGGIRQRARALADVVARFRLD